MNRNLIILGLTLTLAGCASGDYPPKNLAI